MSHQRCMQRTSHSVVILNFPYSRSLQCRCRHTYNDRCFRRGHLYSLPFQLERHQSVKSMIVRTFHTGDAAKVSKREISRGEHARGTIHAITWLRLIDSPATPCPCDWFLMSLSSEEIDIHQMSDAFDVDNLYSLPFQLECHQSVNLWSLGTFVTYWAVEFDLQQLSRRSNSIIL